jgi:hypothetical protein
VDDAGHVGEDHGRDHEPAAPQQVAGQADVGPVSIASLEHAEDQAGESERDEPGDLAEPLVVEEPEQVRLAAENAAETAAAETAAAETAAARAAAAEDAAQAVVAEDQIQGRAGRAAADERLAAGRQQLVDSDPPAARHQDRGHGHSQAQDPAAERSGGREAEYQGEGRQHQVGLQILGQEGQADQRRRQRHPAVAAALNGANQRPGGHDQEQGQQRVRVVEAEDQDRSRRQGHDKGRDQGRCGAERPLDGREQEAHGGHAAQRLRQQDAPRTEAEDSHREPHQHRGQGRLVDGDEVAGVEAAEEPGGPALRRGQRSGRIVGVGIAADGQVPDVQHPGEGQNREQRRAYPGGIVLRTPNDPHGQTAKETAEPAGGIV